jgi:LmbE family N-acetylglucosaminyl deacetylase
MLTFSWPEPLRILCLGAHSDDIEIGCAGTLLSLANRHVEHVSWIVFSGTGDRGEEARHAAEQILVWPNDVEVLEFKDGYFPFHGERIKDCFEGLKGRVDPNLIFTHSLTDRHQDHRLIAELTWNTFRDHLILEFEVPKYEGDLLQPNLYQPLDGDVVERKLELLMSAFPSQSSRNWFRRDTFSGLMRLRGIECTANYAEAFLCRKLVLGSAAGPSQFSECRA